MQALTKINSHGIPDAPKDAVAFWDNMAAQFARGSVASQVMCGFALIELKKEMGFKQGGFRDQKPNDFGFSNWGEFVEATYNFSDDTARNRITMAEGVRSDFKKLGLAERFKSLLLTHPSAWSETDTKAISDALQKCTDGMTQTDFFRKLGLAKKQSGNPDAIGGKARKLTAEEQAEENKKQALADSGQMGNAVTASNKNFVLCTDFEVNAQIALLERAIKLRRAWTSQPVSKRDVKIIEKLLAEK
jgi:hypothetical protein